jgi:hypothetical protein
LSALVGVTACGSDDNGPISIKTSDAYSAAIRWYLDSVEATPPTTAAGDGSGPLIVYVAPESGKAIDSQAQASVVAEMADMTDRVTVRFADVRDDALDMEVPDLPVKDDGVLLIVGAVTEGPPPVDVDVAVYRNADDEHTFTMRITTAGDSFRATAVSGA